MIASGSEIYRGRLHNPKESDRKPSKGSPFQTVLDHSSFVPSPILPALAGQSQTARGTNVPTSFLKTLPNRVIKTRLDVLPSEIKVI
jgi:hypothetical protein